jgi:hypothetical protein
MAQVTITKMVEGPASVVVKVDLLNNDNTVELEDFVFFSPSDLSPPLPNSKPAFRLMQAWYDGSSFDFTIKSGSVTPFTFWTFSKAAQNHIDFRSFGGLTDPTTHAVPPADVSGKFTISTKGFGPVGTAGSFILELRKLA